jgi:tetratricopeptide (TPR) repeat protein
MPKALAAAGRALQLDSTDWRGYYIRGVYRAMFDYDWTGAGRDLDRAVEMHPAVAMSRHGRAFFYLIPMGRTEEALAAERLALESDPLSIPVRSAEALLLYSLGRDEEAAQRARTGLGLFPGVWVAAWIFGHVLNRLGFADEAAAAVEHALGKAPRNPWLLATLALTHSRRGQSGEAAGILAQLEELSAQQYVSPLAMALADAGSGDVEGTFRYLDRAVEERDPMLAWFVRDPLIAKLPDGGRYQALLRSMNLA